MRVFDIVAGVLRPRPNSRNIMKSPIIHAALISCLAFTSWLNAEEGGPAMSPKQRFFQGGGGERPGGDGKGEWTKKRGHMREEMVQKFDKNEDGKLDDSEREKAREAMQARREHQGEGQGDGKKEGGRGEMMDRMKEKFDANKDGQLDEKERETARGEMQKRREGTQKMREEMMKKFDANSDGQLDDSERAEMQKARDARRAEMMKQFDANGDGELDESEKEAAMAAHRKKMQEGGAK
jgi:Ca2+-binding EF-hand superfamily protein